MVFCVLRDLYVIFIIYIKLGSKYAKPLRWYTNSFFYRIFNAGGQPQLRNFYPEVTFPVSRGTNLTSCLVKWDHSVSWELPFLKPQNVYSGIVTINLRDNEYSHLEDYKIGRKLFIPGMTYVVCIKHYFNVRSLYSISLTHIPMFEILNKSSKVLIITNN